MTQAETIDDVLAELDRVIATSRAEAGRFGYFAALYRKVTAAVKQGIVAGEFEDGPRIERLDVIFANRYLEAYQAARRGDRPTAAWQVCFDVAPRWPPIVLQHLLLGMNAHINLDLGIAAARTAPGAALPQLRGDFDRINALLASLLDTVKGELEQVWPPLAAMARLSRGFEDRPINFSMTKARDAAWAFAERLAPQAIPEQADEIERRDRWVASFAWGLARPPLQVRSALLLIRLGERRSVAEIIDILGG